MEVFLLGAAVSGLSTAALNTIVAREGRTRDVVPLVDLVHQLTPAAPVWVPDVILLAVLPLFCYAKLDSTDTRLRALGLAFTARSVLIHLTRLPSPVPVGAYCYGWDMFVSGHTLIFCACAAATPGLSALGCLSLIVSRQHYTIDVVGAAMVYNIALNTLA